MIEVCGRVRVSASGRECVCLLSLFISMSHGRNITGK